MRRSEPDESSFLAMSSTLTCSILAAVGKVSTVVGLEGAT